MIYHVYAQPDTGEELIKANLSLTDAHKLAAGYLLRGSKQPPVEITHEDGESLEWWVLTKEGAHVTSDLGSPLRAYTREQMYKMARGPTSPTRRR